MNDRNLFKAKRLDDGEWVQGYLCPPTYPGFIGTHWHIAEEIDSKFGINGKTWIYETINLSTIGQSTGLRDSTKWEDLSSQEQRVFTHSLPSKHQDNPQEHWEGKLMFEGDVVKTKDGLVGSIQWQVNYWKIDLSSTINKTRYIKHDSLGYHLVDLEIIGNIHDKTDSKLV